VPLCQENGAGRPAGKVTEKKTGTAENHGRPPSGIRRGRERGDKGKSARKVVGEKALPRRRLQRARLHRGLVGRGGGLKGKSGKPIPNGKKRHIRFTRGTRSCLHLEETQKDLGVGNTSKEIIGKKVPREETKEASRSQAKKKRCCSTRPRHRDPYIGGGLLRSQSQNNQNPSTRERGILYRGKAKEPYDVFPRKQGTLEGGSMSQRDGPSR